MSIPGLILPSRRYVKARYFAPLATNPAALGLLDDAAVLSIPEGQELVATCDTITAGVHFLTNDPPDTVGYKALSVSLSDLAAKGARPYVYLLSVALPDLPKPPWLVDGPTIAGMISISGRTIETAEWRKILPHYAITQRCIRYDVEEVKEYLRNFHRAPKEAA